MKPPALLLSLMLSSLALFTACSSTPTNLGADNWSEDLPPKSYFSAHYQQDSQQKYISTEENYLLWVKRFYFGWELYGRGWLKATNELVETLPNKNDRKEAKEKSLLIAKLVAPEWAKDKQYRVINTRHLIIWGNALNESTIKKEQLLILDRILRDVNTLLDRKIQPKDIASNRYYQPEAFGDNFQ
ncbi:MAG: hypothetical protein ACRBCI_11125 [Cellvibrionaceae bacterium]